MEPQAFGGRDLGQLPDGIDGARVRGPGDRRDREGSEARRTVARHGRCDRPAAQVEPFVGLGHDERLGWEAEQIEGSPDREVGLVRRVDPRALEPRAARRPIGSEQPTEMDVARQRHRHEIGHDPARREQTEALLAVADEVAQPADDLLLHERRHGAGVPDIDPLVGHLGEELAHHRHRQRRRREIAELAGMLGVHQGARDAPLEFLEDGTGRGRVGGRGRRTSGPAVVRAPKVVVRAGVTHRSGGGLAVQEIEGGRPGVGAQAGQRCSRGPFVAIAHQLGLRVPGEALQVRVDVGRRRRMLRARRPRRCHGDPSIMTGRRRTSAASYPSRA